MAAHLGPKMEPNHLSICHRRIRTGLLCSNDPHIRHPSGVFSSLCETSYPHSAHRASPEPYLPVRHIILNVKGMKFIRFAQTYRRMSVKNFPRIVIPGIRQLVITSLQRVCHRASTQIAVKRLGSPDQTSCANDPMGSGSPPAEASTPCSATCTTPSCQYSSPPPNQLGKSSKRRVFVTPQGYPSPPHSSSTTLILFLRPSLNDRTRTSSLATVALLCFSPVAINDSISPTL